MKRLLIVSILLSALVTQIFSATSFSVHDIDGSNNLLYSTRLDFPGTSRSSSLFEIHLEKSSAQGRPSLLTCVPEKMELLSGNVVQLRNAFGTARYSMDSGKLVWIYRSDDFPAGWYDNVRQAESPDGKWICQEDSEGSLVLVHVASGVQIKIREKSSSNDSVLAKWSGDSKFFLYEENGTVYFASCDAAVKNLLPPKSMRRIGEGSLGCVQWVGERLYYASADILYRIDEGELFTRGLYYAVLGNGTPVARLSTNFDTFHDSFWISPDGKYLLYTSGKKIAVLYSIPKEFGFASARKMESLIGLTGSILGMDVMWTSADVPLLWIENLSYTKGKKSASLYSMDKTFSLVASYDEPGCMEISPDGKTVAFTSGKNLETRKIDGWKQVAKIDGEKILSFRWLDSQTIIAGGENSLFRWSTEKGGKWKKTVLYLSSVKAARWDGEKINAWIEGDDTRYQYDAEKNSWTAAGKSNPPDSPGYASNGKFRAYTSECPNHLFDDAVFVRSLSAPAFTYPLIPETMEEKKSRGKVSIIFDATEGNEGLAQVLSVLEDFGIRGTFFINGEFIRRYPMETCQIVASGSRCASGFFTSADLLSKDFEIDADFIRRGLARNEDEFLAATGKELDLMWHAPHYRSNQMMIDAGGSTGYTYIDAWNEINDRVSFEDSVSDKKSRYLGADEIISLTRENLHDGMVISVDVGNIRGSRFDYVYEKIHALIKTILLAGYEIAPL